MKKIYPHVKSLMTIVFILLFVSFIPCFNNALQAQQSVGSHPNIDAGFENQSTGNLGTTQSGTSWTYVSSGSGQSRGISATGGYGGPKFLSVGRANTTSNLSTSVNSNQVTLDTFLPNTKYIIQFHYRQSAGFTGNPDTASFVFISSDGTSGGRKSTKINLGTPPSNWTGFYAIVNTDSSLQATTATCGINIRNQLLPSPVATTIDIDNFVVYPADNQSIPAKDIVAPNPVTGLSASGNPAVVDLSWTAPAGGVDGGGYMVVRYTANPLAEPDPIQNAVYKANAANTIGTTGTVVYVGTANSFSDGGGTPGTNYWYRVYAVDKAFNYSSQATTGPASPSLKINYYYDGTGPTDALTNWWTNKNGTGSNPPNFTNAGQVFRIVTPADLTASLAISGTGSFIIIGEPAPGVPAMTVSFNALTLPGIDTIYQSSDGNPTILNFNAPNVPSINQLFDIFTQVHYRAPGAPISVGTSKTYDKIFVENNADVTFTGNPVVTTSFFVEAGAKATLGVLSSKFLTVNAGATATINGTIVTPKVAGLVSSNVGTTANTFGAIQFIGTGDIVLGPLSTVEYSGISTTTSQSITTRTDYVNMIISGPGVSKTFSGAITLAGSLTLNTTGSTGGILSGGVLKVNGDLILTNGFLNTDATNILELGATSNVIGGSNSSHIAGPMRRNTNGTGVALFPVGKGGIYGPISITPSTGTASLYKAEYFNTANSITAVTAPLTAVSPDGYWDASKISGSNATVSLSLNGVPVTGATAANELVVARLNGTSWISENVTPINPGNATSGTAVSGVLTNFGLFTFGLKPTSIVPVKIISFSGMVKEGFVNLSLSVAKESNIRNYIVEESKDGGTFKAIGSINPLNTSQHNYNFICPAALTSNSFFRIKIINLDGKIEYTNIILIKTAIKGKLVIMNTLVSDKRIRLQLSDVSKGIYNLQLLDMQGRIIQKNVINYEGNMLSTTIPLNMPLSNGQFLVRLTGNNYSETSKIMIQ